MRPMQAVRTAATFGALAALAAGCGGSTNNTGGVAHLGTTTTRATSIATSTAASAAAPSDPGAQAIKFSECMRAHGVPNFPNPQVSQNGNSVKVAIRVNPGETNSPKFGSAQKACRSLLPSGNGRDPILSPALQAQYLKAAACIRAHGVPSFPDPVFTNGGAHIPNAQSYNLNAPPLKTAIQACLSVIPAGALGGSSSAQPSGSS